MKLVKHIAFLLAMLAAWVALTAWGEGRGWDILVVTGCVHLGAVTREKWPV